MTEPNEGTEDPRSKAQLRDDFAAAQGEIGKLEERVREQSEDLARFDEQVRELKKSERNLARAEIEANTNLRKAEEKIKKLEATKLSDEQQARVEAIKAARTVLEQTGFVSSKLAGASGELIAVAQWIMEGGWDEDDDEEEAEPEPDGGIAIDAPMAVEGLNAAAVRAASDHEYRAMREKAIQMAMPIGVGGGYSTG